MFADADSSYMWLGEALPVRLNKSPPIRRHSVPTTRSTDPTLPEQVYNSKAMPFVRFEQLEAVGTEEIADQSTDHRGNCRYRRQKKRPIGRTQRDWNQHDIGGNRKKYRLYKLNTASMGTASRCSAQRNTRSYIDSKIAIRHSLFH